MLEATPGKPWGIGFKDLLKVESNMRWRYVTERSTQMCCMSSDNRFQARDYKSPYGTKRIPNHAYNVSPTGNEGRLHIAILPSLWTGSALAICS